MYYLLVMAFFMNNQNKLLNLYCLCEKLQILVKLEILRKSRAEIYSSTVEILLKFFTKHRKKTVLDLNSLKHFSHMRLLSLF